MRNHTFIQHVNIVSHGWTQTTLSLETFHLFIFFFNNFLLLSCPSRCFHYQFVTKNYYFHHMWQRIISLFLPSPRKFFFFLKLKSSCCGKSGIIFTRIVNRKYLKSCSNLFVCCFVSLDRFYFPYMSSCTYYNTHIFRNVF